MQTSEFYYNRGKIVRIVRIKLIYDFTPDILNTKFAYMTSVKLLEVIHIFKNM